MASTAKDFDEIFEEELHEIRERREVCRLQSKQSAGQGADCSEKPQSDEDIEVWLREELAGLALSGGGVRSAAFNLGLLQALYQSGRMKDVDYLSTVSGGGYAGALFSASVANDKDGVNWDRGSRFNRLPIEPLADGSQPPRIYELALHGRAMSRPLQWLSRHLWGWILTILFVISGVIAVASILAWLMRIVWSHENILTVQSQGFATDLHIAFYPAFLALLFWAFCNLASVVMRAINVRIPPISRFAYVLLIVTIVLGAVSFSAIGDFDMSDYVSAKLVPASWSETVNRILDNFGRIALGLLSLCLLPLLTPHRLLESGRNREKPLFRFAFNTAGFAIICGVPLAVFYLLSQEDVSGYNLERPHSGAITQGHLEQLDAFISDLEGENPTESKPNQDLRDSVTSKIREAIEASGEYTTYPSLRKEIVDDQQAASLPTRMLQYVAYRLGLHEKFAERVERRRSASRARANVANQISMDVLTDPYLFEAGPDTPLATDNASERSSNGILSLLFPAVEASNRNSNASALDSTIAGNASEKLTTDSSDSLVAAGTAPSVGMILQQLHLANRTDAERLGESIENIRAPRRVLSSDYSVLFTEAGWWWKPRMSLIDLKKANKNLDKDSFRLVLAASVLDDLGNTKIAGSAGLGGAGNVGGLGIRRLIFEVSSIFGPLSAVISELLQDDAEPGSTDHPQQFNVARRLAELQHQLDMDSSILPEKLDEKLKIAFGEEWKNAEFLAVFERLHEAEKRHVNVQLQRIRTSNWDVVSAMYPAYIKPRKTVYAWNVNEADQAFRLRIAGYSTLVFLFVGLVANLNKMCLHGVYRDQLAAVWLPTGPLMLKDLDTCRHGGPLHLFNATLNRHGWQLDPDAEGMSRFVFSHRFCGSKRFGYRETWEYENGEVGLADAVAISGAAVSTSYAGDLLFRTLLFLTNFRLGQWVRNPKHFHEEHYWPSPIRILISRLWHPTDRAYVDLTDGGHLDNTGLSSLLERRCRVMIVGDCSQDKHYRFESLFAVLQAARAKYGIQIDEFEDRQCESNRDATLGKRSIDALDHLIPDKSKNFESQSHFAVLKLRYPKQRSEDRHKDGSLRAEDRLSAVLIIVKPTLTGDEPADLLARRRLDDGFPNDPTVNQFLEPDQFESYVMLGRHIGEQLDQFISGGELDHYDLPAPWCSQQRNAEIFGEEFGQLASSELPVPSAVAQLLNPLRFDKPGIDVAIALIRQWAEAEYENDQELLSTSRDVFDHIIRPVSKWAYEEGADRPLALRRQFCKKLIEILEEHTWIAQEADEETRNDFRNMLEGLGDGVAGIASAVASLSPKSERDAEKSL